MSHLGSYWWIRKTQVIPELGLNYNVRGVLLGVCLIVKNRVGGYFILHFFYKILCILKFGRKEIWEIKKINFYIIVIVPPIAA